MCSCASMASTRGRAPHEFDATSQHYGIELFVLLELPELPSSSHLAVLGRAAYSQRQLACSGLPALQFILGVALQVPNPSNRSCRHLREHPFP